MDLNQETLNLELIDKETLETRRSNVSIDGLAAAWFLFQFSRKNKSNKASETFKSVQPDGSLKIINIEVECNYSGKTGKTKPTLPGAFAQDVFLSIVDKLMINLKNDLPEIENIEQIKIRKGKVLPDLGMDFPEKFKTLYFRNKDIAENIGMTVKNARITDAINQLHRTHIKITGFVHKDGKSQKVEHQSYYIPTFQSAGKIRGGMEKSNWHSVQLDNMLVKQMMAGYITQIDKNKLLKLSSGAPRKLYTLLASKKMTETKDGNKVILTEQEIRSTLQITKTSFKVLFTKYAQSLISAGIIKSFSTSLIDSEKLIIFEFTNDELLLQGRDNNGVEEYFNNLTYLSNSDPKLKKVITSEQFDIDIETLEEIIINKKITVKSNFRFKKTNYEVNKAILWLDRIIWTCMCSQNILSVKALLLSCLKKNEEPAIRSEKRYIPLFVLSQIRKNEQLMIRERMKNKLEAEQLEERIENEVTRIIASMTLEQRNNLNTIIKDKAKKMMPNNLERAMDIYSRIMVRHGLENAMDFDNILEIYEHYLENGSSQFDI